MFLPLTPVLFLLLLDSAYATLSHFQLYGLASAVDAVTIFTDVVPLLPYWAVSFLIFGMRGSTPYPLQMVELLAVGLLFCVALFILDILYATAFNRAQNI